MRCQYPFGNLNHVSIQLSLSLIGSPSCKVSEEGTSAQPHDVSGGKDTEDRDNGDQSIALWKEDFAQSRCHYSIEGEVIPLHHVAGHSGNDCNRLERGGCGSGHAGFSRRKSNGLEKSHEDRSCLPWLTEFSGFTGSGRLQ